jgi:hypothetical protein
MAAKPMNRTTLAFHATPSPLYEKLSPDKRLLSMLLMMSRPRHEKIMGIQSMKVTWKSEPLRSDLLKVAASNWRKIEMANCTVSYVRRMRSR